MQDQFKSTADDLPSFQDVISHTDLLIEEAQDHFTRDPRATAKNYAEAKAVLHIGARYTLASGNQHSFSFLIAKDVLELGWAEVELIDVKSGATPSEGKAVPQPGFDHNQVFPVLIFIGDLVNGPEGVIRSGVWALGHDEIPFGGSEFLFQAIEGPGIWEWKRLPGLIETTEWKPYARRSDAAAFDRGHDRLIEGRAKAKHYIDHIKGDVAGEVFLAACDEVSKLSVLLKPEGVGFGLKEPIDSRFEFVELAVSSFDVFL